MAGSVDTMGTLNTVSVEDFQESQSIIASLGVEEYDSKSTGSERDFREKWDELTEKLWDVRTEVEDLDQRLSGSRMDEAVNLARQYSNFVEIEHGPFGREEDMKEHTQEHFEWLFNGDNFNDEFRSPTTIKDIELLIKFAEIVYINDAVYRFIERTRFVPQADDLDEINFMSLPDELAEWMEEGELIYLSLAPDTSLEINDIGNRIDRLYEQRNDFIESAMEFDLFHPVMPDSVSETHLKGKNIRSKWNRGGDEGVSVEKVHNHCYTSLKENSVWTKLM